MHWFGMYVAAAVALAIAVFAAADWLRQDHVPAPDHLFAISMVAGLLWPALMLGIVELALIFWAHRMARTAPA